ncbi:MAG TPA: aromatic-ring-hydroxylating dioxygenase subunit beta, partial [Methylomirabilota bacterium]|nr:aromatic-ring-hydroxylating dioxygenase subunit beta [Methylomirabilota bacterium]
MVSDQDHQAVVEFLYREARLADEARYAEWLALWTDDAVYWVPASTDPDADPETRIKLLQTG